MSKYYMEKQMVNNFNQLFYKDSYQKTFATKVIDSKLRKINIGWHLKKLVFIH